MIVRVIDSSTTYADREALATWLGLSQMTIRRHCAEHIVGRDEETGRTLYDADRVADRLAGISGRPYRLGIAVKRDTPALST